MISIVIYDWDRDQFSLSHFIDSRGKLLEIWDYQKLMVP